MLLNSGTAGGRSALRPLLNNNENAGTENRQGKNLDENSHSTKKAKSVRLAFAPKSANKNGSTGSKTPAQSQRRRRALGDISNRKQGKSLGGGGGAAGGGGASKAKSVTFQAPGHRSTAQRTPFAPKNGATPAGSAKRPDGVVPKSRSTSDTPRATIAPAEHVEDVELPAGRLWENSAFFDDGLNGSIAIEELRDLRGAQDDVDAFLRNQRETHRRAREKHLADADAALAEKMEKIALDDYEDVMGGMDRLLDGIEDDYGDDPILHQSSDSDMYRRPIDNDLIL